MTEDDRTIAGEIEAFLEKVRGLMTGDDGWAYFIDLYDAVEEHRHRIRGLSWPPSVSSLDASTYRLLLLHLDHTVAENIIAMPLDGDSIPDRADFITGVLSEFLGRADALLERLGGTSLQ